MQLWIIGGGGLFGSALTRQAQTLGYGVSAATHIPWHDHETARAHVRMQAQAFLRRVNKESKTSPGPCTWAIIWAAGKVTTASRDHEAEQELAFFTSVIEDLGELIGHHGAGSPGAFVLASSAGGIYAGSSDPPFHAASMPVPLGTYGHLKRAQEEAALRVLGVHVAVLIGRIANLYGPGQDLTKLQGLISRLALSGITREPLTMFVPLDTLRDYIYADDAAQVALHWLSILQPGEQRIRVIASGEPMSLGHLIGLMQDIARSRLPVAYGIHASAVAQAHDLRLVPDEDETIRSLPHVSLPAGMKSVYLDILDRHQTGAPQD